MARRDLLLEICSCPNVKTARASGEHPCAKVVVSQEVSRLDDFQVPAPWVGQIHRAPILFVSSNPSISKTEHHPTWRKSGDFKVDYFENHFGGGEKEWTKGGTRTLQRNGTYSEPVRFLSGVKNRAEELLLREPEPGVDYAITWAVRCKSRDEFGVSDALDRCASRYLRKTIVASKAQLVVVLGDYARDAVRRLFRVLEGDDCLGSSKIGRRERHFAWLPHPTHRSKPRKFSNCFSADEIAYLQALVA